MFWTIAINRVFSCSLRETLLRHSDCCPPPQTLCQHEAARVVVVPKQQLGRSLRGGMRDQELEDVVV